MKESPPTGAALLIHDSKFRRLFQEAGSVNRCAMSGTRSIEAHLLTRRVGGGSGTSRDRSSGNDGNEPPDLHPFVQGLLKELPKAGTAWPEDQRKLWLDTAASIFKMIYKDSAPNKIPPPPGDAEYRKSQNMLPRSDVE
jgi:hypothetical protein